MPIGAAIEDLLLIWQVSEAEEWINQLRRLLGGHPNPANGGHLKTGQ